ncbi:hypothetical protein ACH5RR_029111 [Cinchona calisaya]|uniref:Reverse transcriptase RNase H-like domain-containing protein n=1 Tax=Cinchona calisaya TaxID=153742 RepID=A0ABD2YUM4_9GENT
MGLSICEKELLSSITAVFKWRHYLLGYHFIIKNDHESHNYLLEHKITTALEQKWLSKLMGMDYEIQYKKGKDNMVADALSRRLLAGDLASPNREELASVHSLQVAVKPA